MNLLERAKKICLTPHTEWPVIAGETTPTADLITGYVLPLVAIGALAGFIGGSLVGQTVPFLGTYRTPLATGLGMAVFTVVVTVLGVLLLSAIINALAPTFGAEKNSAQATKLAVYSITPAWIAGVFQILPVLGVLALVGALYGVYLLYLGLPRLMKCPQEKAIGYTAVVVVGCVVIGVVMAAAGGMIIGTGRLGAGVVSGVLGGGEEPEVKVDPSTPLGRLQQLGQELEESAQTAEAAAKSGNQGAQVAAAVEGLGALLGGGRRVDPLDIEQLKPFVPETFAGLPRRSSSAEKTGVGIMVVSKAEATYGDGAERSVTLEVLDSGGASGLVGLAGWANVQGEKEDEDGVERTQKVDGRLVHEKISKRGGTNELSIVLGDRFVVNARGNGIDFNALKAAVSSLNLGKLESMKDIGVQR